MNNIINNKSEVGKLINNVRKMMRMIKIKSKWPIAARNNNDINNNDIFIKNDKCFQVSYMSQIEIKLIKKIGD